MLKNIFPGCGGDASIANCKAQFGYEYLSGTFSFYEITHGTAPDNRYSARLPDKINRDELLRMVLFSYQDTMSRLMLEASLQATLLICILF